MSGAACVRLPDGRLHLQHGPIDVLVECWGDASEVEAAQAQAVERFDTILEELVSELPRLREPVGPHYPLLRGTVARRMAASVWPHRGVFITPMAAVAGAVADELMQALLAGRHLAKAAVNDGGDLALHLHAGQSLAIGVVSNIAARASMRARGSMPGCRCAGWPPPAGAGGPSPSASPTR